MSTKPIFVFGSNEAGIHGAGAALVARREHGAILGKGEGHYGDSYAIPTKDHRIQTLPISEVVKYVQRFKTYAASHPEFTFQVTRIGCGLAGFNDAQIARLFHGSTDNCLFDTYWMRFLKNEYKYWGAY